MQKDYLHLVRHALNAGFVISVWDGEEWQIKNSASYKAVKGAIESVDESSIRIRYPATKALLASAYIILGNGADECVADYSDIQWMETWRETYEAANGSDLGQHQSESMMARSAEEWEVIRAAAAKRTGNN